MATSVFAQAAVSSSTNPQETATPQISPTPPQNEGPAPRIPAIEELDQAFKQSSLGKAADEARLHWFLGNQFVIPAAGGFVVGQHVVDRHVLETRMHVKRTDALEIGAVV